MRSIKRLLILVLVMAGGGLAWLFWPVTYSSPALPDHFQGTVIKPAIPIRL